MFVSGWKWKKRKIMIPSPFHINSSCPSRKIPTEKEREKKERKKNTDTTQTKLNASHVQFNVKILPQ